MSGYQEFRYYSPRHDADMVRISMWNAHGHEYFMHVPDTLPGQSWRQRREEALEAIMAAMEFCEPGEVRVG